MCLWLEDQLVHPYLDMQPWRRYKMNTRMLDVVEGVGACANADTAIRNSAVDDSIGAS